MENHDCPGEGHKLLESSEPKSDMAATLNVTSIDNCLNKPDQQPLLNAENDSLNKSAAQPVLNAEDGSLIKPETCPVPSAGIKIKPESELDKSSQSDADQNREHPTEQLKMSFEEDEMTGETNIETEIEDNSGIPVDRGWAWMIVVGCFGMHIFSVGGIKSFGVLFVEFEDKFKTSSKALATVQAVAATLMLGLGALANVLSTQFTCRSVMMTGGILTGVGFVSSAFIPSFEWLYLTYGIITGVGFALSYAPCVVMVGHHFKKRRALANGLSVSGSGIGSFVLPNLMRLLMDEYGIQGALIIIGALMSNICVCASLIRPLSSYKPKKKSKKTEIKPEVDNNSLAGNAKPEETEPIQKSTESNKLLASHKKYFSEDTQDMTDSNRSLNERKKLHRFRSVEHSTPSNLDSPLQHKRIRLISDTDSITGKSESSLYASTGDLVLTSLQNIPEHHPRSIAEQLQDTKDTVSEQKSTCCSWTCPPSQKPTKPSVPLFDFSLLLNPVLLMYMMSIMLANFAYPNVFMMLPSYSSELDLGKTTGALLLSIIGLSDLAGRVFFGWFSDLKLFPRRYGFLGTMAVSGVLNVLLPQVKKYEMLVFFCSTYGFFAGSYVALIAVVLVDCLGIEKLSSSFGIATCAMAVGLLVGPPMLGAIRDATHSWSLAFVVCGIVAILGAAIVLLEPLAQRLLKEKEKKKQEEALELGEVCTNDELLER